MKYHKSIALTGFMGSGKSLVGQELAKALSLPFYDLDQVIESSEQRTVPRIFEESGEQHFRKLEQHYLMSLLNGPDAILALGGGTLLDSDRVRLVRKHARLVYLRASVEVLLTRLRGDRDRPLLLDSAGRPLDNGQLAKKIKRLLEERDPVYLKSDLVLPVEEDSNLQSLIQQILRLLNDHAANRRIEY